MRYLACMFALVVIVMSITDGRAQTSADCGKITDAGARAKCIIDRQIVDTTPRTVTKPKARKRPDAKAN
jgi:hypothetical protein